MGDEATPDETPATEPSSTVPVPSELSDGESLPDAGLSTADISQTQELTPVQGELPVAADPVAASEESEAGEEGPVADEPTAPEPAEGSDTPETPEEPETSETPETPDAPEGAAQDAPGATEAEAPAVPVPVVAAASESGPAHAAPGRSVGRTVLAVVASLAILAGAVIAGFAYGRSSAPGPDIVVQSDPAVEKPAEADAMAVGAMPSTLAPMVSLRLARSGGPTAVLTAAPGLPDDPGSAPGYRLVNSGISGAQVAAVLATTFGVKGSSVEEDGTWTIGKADGPRVTVVDDPLFTWAFEDPVRLANPLVGQQLEAADAIDLANTLLSGIGVDTGTVDWQVDRYFDRTAVRAWQLVNEQRTQLGWLVAFDPEGAVVQASGFSAGLEPTASYSVIGAASAVRRSQQPPWWTLGATQVARPLIDPAVEPEQSAEPSAEAEPSDEPIEPIESSAVPSDVFTPEPSALPSSAASGSGIPSTSATDSATSGLPSTPPPTAPVELDQPGLVVSVDNVTVTEAELGLAQYWQPDGSVLMLPSYLLTGQDGSRWSLLAIADEYVNFVPSTDPLGDGTSS